MKRRARLWVSACLYYSGIVGMARAWARRHGPRLTIVYYHQAVAVDLRSHWGYLRRHYRVLPLEAALGELRAGQVPADDRRSLLAVTFDDGYLDNYEQAFPLARELQVPMTIFLVSGYVEKGCAFWWTTRLLRFARMEQVTFAGQSYTLRELDKRQALAEAIDACYRQCASLQAREQFLAGLYTALAIPPGFILEGEPAPLVSWGQVREMQESGWVTFGAHTVHHPNLGELSDPVVARAEVEQSRLAVQEQSGQPVSAFAYPFGRTGKYGPDAARWAGFEWALTTRPGVNTCWNDPYLLLRRNMSGPKHWLVVAAETAGIWSVFSRLKRLCLAVSRAVRGR